MGIENPPSSSFLWLLPGLNSLLAVGLCSLPHRPLHRLPEYPSNTCPRPSDQREREKENKTMSKKEATVFFNLISEETYPHYCCMLLVPQNSQPWYNVGEDAQVCKNQEVRIIGNHLGGWLLHYLIYASFRSIIYKVGIIIVLGS